MVAFILGLLIGVVLGFLVCAVLSASGREEMYAQNERAEEEETANR